MQQTSKYQFNLVEGSDDFSPTPLNQNMEKVEEVLDDMEDAIDGVMEAAYTPDNKPYVTGQYTCQSSLLNISLGFKPTMVIVAGDTASTDGTPGQYSGVLFSGYSNANASITNDGFSVGDAGTYPNLAQRYRRYYYIAFR